MATRISLIENKINKNPDYISIPDSTKNPTVKELSSEVAKLGSNYQELSANVKLIKDTTSSLQSYQTTLKANVTLINVCKNT